MKFKRHYFNRIISLALVTAMLAICTLTVPVFAKTETSARGDMLFFYATDKNGKDVLIKTLTYDELSKLSHGQEDGESYMYSSTDNYPTTQYCEGKGFTIPELVKYAGETSGVSGADKLTFDGDDALAFMATDSYGNYNRSWTVEELYGQKRYYFEGMYEGGGWNVGWECGNEDTSRDGMSLEEYNSGYASSDTYYNDKRTVFSNGKEMPTILATQSYSGRTTSKTLAESAEPGLAGYINANGGKVSGCLSKVLSDAYSLRLCIPMTEADLMSGHRTAYDNFKWIYNVRLKNASTSIASSGTIPAPTAAFSLNGDTLSITISCEDDSADIYYSFDGSPQIKYTGSLTYDVKDRNLTSEPVTIYMSAVKEGYDDAGVLSAKYPQSGVTFKALYSEQTGKDITFTAESTVSASDWKSWKENIIGISVKKPQSSQYEALAADEYAIDDDAKSITFDKSIFDASGAYSFVVYAKGFSNKTLSVSAKKAAPALTEATYQLGQQVTLSFDDSEYQDGMYIYVVNPDSGDTVLIPATYLDRTKPGKVTIKKEYFESQSCELNKAGKYTLELTNNSFTPVSQKVEITITDENGAVNSSDEAAAFTDVGPDAWYAEAVGYAVKNGLFSGTSASTFSPSASMTRAMLVTVLWRMDGKPAAASGVTFTDVRSSDYYYDAVAWAAANGIVSGMSEETFGPAIDITREQLAAILMRYAQYKGENVTASGDLADFTDVTSVAEYAIDALRWAVEKNYISGISADTIAPKSGATRAQVAVILMRYAKK